ncbi:hypothetical protein DXA34_14700, partial [[Clostridium] symbiosum]
ILLYQKKPANADFFDSLMVPGASHQEPFCLQSETYSCYMSFHKRGRQKTADLSFFRNRRTQS